MIEPSALITLLCVVFIAHSLCIYTMCFHIVALQCLWLSSVHVTIITKRGFIVVGSEGGIRQGTGVISKLLGFIHLFLMFTG